MTTRTRRRGRQLAAALAITAAAVASCSKHAPDYGEHDDTGTGVPSGAIVQTLPPLPAPWNTLDRNDPAAVAVAAVQAVFDWRPDHGDTGPEDAAHRAAPLFTPRAATDYRPYIIPRPTWQDWMDTHTTITAATTISSEQHPADTAAEWHRKTSTVLTITKPGKPPTTLTVTSLITESKQPVWTVSNLVHLQ